MTTKQRIIEAATRREHGGFVNTDGKWCMTRSPEEFKVFLEKEFGFEVVECKAMAGSTAVATHLMDIRLLGMVIAQREKDDELDKIYNYDGNSPHWW